MTPLPGRPTSRTWPTGNRMDIPLLVPTMTSRFSSVSLASIRTSPSLRPMAMIPLLRISVNSSRRVFLIIPFRVHMRRYWSLVLAGSNDPTAMAEVIFSSGLSWTRFTAALPRAARPPSGTS